MEIAVGAGQFGLEQLVAAPLHAQLGFGNDCDVACTEQVELQLAVVVLARPNEGSEMFNF